MILGVGNNIRATNYNTPPCSEYCAMKPIIQKAEPLSQQRDERERHQRFVSLEDLTDDVDVLKRMVIDLSRQLEDLNRKHEKLIQRVPDALRLQLECSPASHAVGSIHGVLQRIFGYIHVDYHRIIMKSPVVHSAVGSHDDDEDDDVDDDDDEDDDDEDDDDGDDLLPLGIIFNSGLYDYFSGLLLDSKFKNGLCRISARSGSLSGLQWARANGCPWDEYTCCDAAEGGHLHILQWARANGCVGLF